MHLVTSVGGLKPVSLCRGLIIWEMTRVERDWVESKQQEVSGECHYTSRIAT